MHGWIVQGASLIGAVVASMGMMVGTAFSNSATPALKGKYTVLEKEQSTHTPGKVKVTEFADFYCPHCHMFEEQGLPVLEKELGNKIESRWSAFPSFQASFRLPSICMSRLRRWEKVLK